jgi:hypothetical protein
MRPRLSSTPFKLLQQSKAVKSVDSKHKKIPAAATSEHRTHEEDTAVRRVDINHKEEPTAAMEQGVQHSKYPQQVAALSNTCICNETLPQQAAALYNKGSDCNNRVSTLGLLQKLRPQLYLHTKTNTTLRP